MNRCTHARIRCQGHDLSGWAVTVILAIRRVRDAGVEASKRMTRVHSYNDFVLEIKNRCSSVVKTAAFHFTKVIFSFFQFIFFFSFPPTSSSPSTPTSTPSSTPSSPSNWTSSSSSGWTSSSTSSSRSTSTSSSNSSSSSSSSSSSEKVTAKCFKMCGSSVLKRFCLQFSNQHGIVDVEVEAKILTADLPIAWQCIDFSIRQWHSVFFERSRKLPNLAKISAPFEQIEFRNSGKACKQFGYTNTKQRLARLVNNFENFSWLTSEQYCFETRYLLLERKNRCAWVVVLYLLVCI